MYYGERFRQFREMSGLTQVDLSARLHVDQSFIAQIESNRALPPDKIVQDLSFKFGFPPAFFKEPPDDDFPLGSLLFRAKKSMSAREEKEMYRYAQTVYGMLKRMLTVKPVRELSLRLPHGFKDQPKLAAQVTRSELGLAPDAPIAHLTYILEASGVLLLALPRPFENRDAFSLWAGTKTHRPIVVLSAGKPGDRLRYSIAHELGHLVMHKPVSKSTGEIEHEANLFASEFLMPEVAISQEIVPPVTLDTFVALKRRWRVSIQALIMRARDLEIITQRKYRYLFQQLSAKGWRKKEPGAVHVPAEKPRALRKIAELLYGDPINYSRLASDTRLPEAFVRSVLEVYATGTSPKPQRGTGQGEKRSDVIRFPSVQRTG